MDVWHFHLDYWKNCSVHPQDMSSTYISGFGHTSPLSRNGFPYVASARQASSRTHRVSFFLFQDDRLFPAQMCASCSVICTHTQKVLSLLHLLPCDFLLLFQYSYYTTKSIKKEAECQYFQGFTAF